MKDKETILKDCLGKYKSAVVAFSGGVDCTLLARVAKDVIGDNMLLITATSQILSFL